MTDPTPAAPKPTEDESADRKGRGPTRPGVLFADLVEDCEKHPHVADVLHALSANANAKEIRESAKARRKSLKEHVQTEEGEIAIQDETADLVARAEKLSPALRLALVTVLTPAEKGGAS